jgi:membrane protein
MAPAFQRARSNFMRALETVPGARRVVAELVRVEVLDRSMIIAAQALLALIPLVIALAALPTEDFGAGLANRLEEVMSIDQARAALLRRAQNVVRARNETGVIGLLLVLASALSFAKAIQRMHERIWEEPHTGGAVGIRLCLVWLVGWLVYVQAAAGVGGLLLEVTGWEVVRLLVQLVLSTILWWWTAHALLHGRVPWTSLWVGALLTALGILVLVLGSRLFMPGYTASNIAQFGPFGLVFSMASWLVAFAVVMVVSSVLGRVITEHRSPSTAASGP